MKNKKEGTIKVTDWRDKMRNDFAKEIKESFDFHNSILARRIAKKQASLSTTLWKDEKVESARIEYLKLANGLLDKVVDKFLEETK